MPPEGLPWIPQPEILTDDEIVRVAKIAVDHGITKLRLTGGEPLLRPNLIDIVGRMSKLLPRPDIALTTNGIGLAHLAAPLAEAGLTRVNVSLDTLQPARFKELTHRDRFDDVIAGLQAAQRTSLAPIKVNSVLMRSQSAQKGLVTLPMMPTVAGPPSTKNSSAGAEPRCSFVSGVNTNSVDKFSMI